MQQGKGEAMKQFYLCAAALALWLGTAATLPSGRLKPSSSPGESSGGELNHHRSGAFRDGLYLGRLAAERGHPRHVATGRWSTTEDRALFTMGYDHGHGELAAATTAADAEREIAGCTNAVQRRAACQPILN
jgi:hypothetical protein